MRYRITHTTAYRYSEPASLSQNEICLQPKDDDWQQCEEWQLIIAPEPQYQRQRQDFFGNRLQSFMIQHPHNQLTVTALSTVSTRERLFPAAESTPCWEVVVDRLRRRSHPDDLAASQSLFASPLIALTPEVAAFARPSFPQGRPILEAAIDLMHRIFSEFRYDKTATTIDTPVNQVLATRKGVCQDFSHLMISALRSQGLAARYVSGYLETLPPPGQKKLEGADASHAWISLYLPEGGWLDLDPTNGLLPNQQHITLAWGRDYSDVAPVRGVVMGGGAHILAVTVDVRRMQAVALD